MNNELLEIFKLYLQKNIVENKNKDKIVDENSFTYKIAQAALDNKKSIKIGDKIHPVNMTKEKAHRIINEKESNLQEKKKSLSKKQKKIAKLSKPYDEIDSDDLAKLRRGEKIDEFVEELDERKKRRKKRKKSRKKKKKSSAGGLSAATKETLKKKAKKRLK